MSSYNNQVPTPNKLIKEFKYERGLNRKKKICGVKYEKKKSWT